VLEVDCVELEEGVSHGVAEVLAVCAEVVVAVEAVIEVDKVAEVGVAA